MLINRWIDQSMDWGRMDRPHRPNDEWIWGAEIFDAVLLRWAHQSGRHRLCAPWISLNLLDLWWSTLSTLIIFDHPWSILIYFVLAESCRLGVSWVASHRVIQHKQRKFGFFTRELQLAVCALVLFCAVERLHRPRFASRVPCAKNIQKIVTWRHRRSTHAKCLLVRDVTTRLATNKAK